MRSRPARPTASSEARSLAISRTSSWSANRRLLARNLLRRRPRRARRPHRNINSAHVFLSRGLLGCSRNSGSFSQCCLFLVSSTRPRWPSADVEVVDEAGAVGGAACHDPRAGPAAEAGPDRKHGRKGGPPACRGPRPRTVVEACPGLKRGLAACRDQRRAQAATDPEAERAIDPTPFPAGSAGATGPASAVATDPASASAIGRVSAGATGLPRFPAGLAATALVSVEVTDP